MKEREGLTTCPIDIWRRILEWLNPTELMRLRICGESKLMSLMVNLKISELRVSQVLPIQNVLSGLGSHLQKLKIHLYEYTGSLNLGKIEFAHRWVPALPKTLV